MKENERIQNRIDELIAELSECREDERNTQNQILQIISLAGTILGILLGATYINSDSGSEVVAVFHYLNDIGNLKLAKLAKLINSYVTIERIIFWLSVMLFCAAFTYITALGINNVLRYYHIQNLEDRLSELIKNMPDDEGRNNLLHWNSYIAPIITMNPKHISSTHTVLNYFCLVVAVCCIVLFSMGTVITLFLKISSRQWFDYVPLGIMILIMLIAFILFMRLSHKARVVAQFAWDTAHENQDVRLKKEGTLYKNAGTFRKRGVYFLYPKTDFQKPILVLAGFVCGIILTGSKLSGSNLSDILLVLFVFEFLAYQARYQINDIRGRREDVELGKSRLFDSTTVDSLYLIKLSFGIACVRIILALFITLVLGVSIRKLLLISLGLLVAITWIYEKARTIGKKEIDGNAGAIFILVGMGYPLRFFLGLFTIVPFTGSLGPDMLQIVCFAAALWAYGSFSSILVWAGEVTSRMKLVWDQKNDTFPIAYEKKHYMKLQECMRERFIAVQKGNEKECFWVMREKGKLGDPWNKMLLISLGCFIAIAFLERLPVVLLLLESAAFLAYVFSIIAYRKWKLFWMLTGWMVLVTKMIGAAVCFEIDIWYFLFTAAQLIITFTYFLLCYQPQVKMMTFRQTLNFIMYVVVRKVLGEDVGKLFKKRMSDKNGMG